jgi:hypothetical protein
LLLGEVEKRIYPLVALALASVEEIVSRLNEGFEPMEKQLQVLRLRAARFAQDDTAGMGASYRSNDKSNRRFLRQAQDRLFDCVDHKVREQLRSR